MPEIHILMSLVGTIFGLIVTIITLIIRGVKLSKTRKWCEQSLQIATAVLPFICEAEKLSHFTGLEKKAYVMMRASQFAKLNKIRFNEIQVSSRIEELVELTRHVNENVKLKQEVEVNKATGNDWL